MSSPLAMTRVDIAGNTEGQDGVEDPAPALPGLFLPDVGAVRMGS